MSSQWVFTSLCANRYARGVHDGWLVALVRQWQQQRRVAAVRAFAANKAIVDVTGVTEV